MKYKKDRPISGFTIFSLVFTLISVVLVEISKRCVAAADFLNSTLCFGIRRALAAFSSLFPISFYEIVLLSAPLIVIAVIVLAVRVFKRGYGRLRFFINILALILFFYAGNLIVLGISYNTTTVDKEMDIPIVTVNAENLAETMIALRDEVNSIAPTIKYNDDGASDPCYTMDEISDKICKAYSDFSAEYGFVPDFSSRAKAVGSVGSIVMSYLGITGIYFYPTGESNVNMAYPAYDVVFTTAHELSHQRGVLRENEANFMAYIILSRSEDSYLRYSAALNMYSYIASALYRTDSELYFEIASGLCDEAKGDLRATSDVSEKYGDTFISDISSKINDLFLKSHGTAGVVTYGRVVTLTVSYFESKK